MFLSACSSAPRTDSDDPIIDCAEEYAEAVVDADIDDIVDILYKGDSYEDDIEALVEGGEANLYYSDVCDAIQSTMTYEIDEKSVESSKDKASVTITFSLVDYEAATKSCLMPGCERETFIKLLSTDYYEETCSRDFISFEQEINLVKKDGKWLVDDDHCSQLLEVYGFYEDMLTNWYSYEHIYDDAGVMEMTDGFYEYYGISERDYLDCALTRFYERTGIRAAVCTVYEEDYSEWPSLLDYSLDKYAELFGEDETRCLVVFSIPRSQRDAYVSGTLDNADWAFEIVQGDKTDKILTEEVCRCLVSYSYDMLMNSGPGFSFAVAFNLAYDILDPYSEDCPHYKRLDY